MERFWSRARFLFDAGIEWFKERPRAIVRARWKKWQANFPPTRHPVQRTRKRRPPAQRWMRGTVARRWRAVFAARANRGCNEARPASSPAAKRRYPEVRHVNPPREKFPAARRKNVHCQSESIRRWRFVRQPAAVIFGSLPRSAFTPGDDVGQRAEFLLERPVHQFEWRARPGRHRRAGRNIAAGGHRWPKIPRTADPAAFRVRAATFPTPVQSAKAARFRAQKHSPCRAAARRAARAQNRPARRRCR